MSNLGYLQTSLKGPWTPKLTYTFYPFSWKCRIFW